MLVVALNRLLAVAGKLGLRIPVSYLGLTGGIMSIHIDNFAVLETNGVPRCQLVERTNKLSGCNRNEQQQDYTAGQHCPVPRRGSLESRVCPTGM